MLRKFYSCTNKILTALAVRKAIGILDRQNLAKTKAIDKENQVAQEIEEESKHILERSAVPDVPGPGRSIQASGFAPEPGREGEQNVSERANSKADDMQIKEKIDLAKIKSFKLYQSDSDFFDEDENPQKESVGWPKEPGFWNKVRRVLLFPVNLTLYLTIPTPRIAKEKEPNYLPLIFTVCIIWMGIFSFFITWWLVSLSMAFNLPFLILPMFVLPGGLFLRDFPHWMEFRRKIVKLQNKQKAEEEKNQADHESHKSSTIGPGERGSVRSEPGERKERIPEFYSGPIFTFTMGTSLTWLIYTLINGDILLISTSIYIQLLLLMAVIVVKLIVFVISGFSTPHWLFYFHIFAYVAYLVLVIFIELYF